MNDLGITLAWLGVQVSLVLVPGLVLYALAARRGPAAGASVAALCLGLVVALTVAALLPGMGRGRRAEPGRLEGRSPAMPDAAPAGDSIATASDAPGRPPGGRWPLAGWRIAWARFESGAAEPAARCRPWAGALAVLLLAGTAAGLLRLALGLGAVVACRRRGRPVEDPVMVGLLDELRRAIGCRAAVELREVPDLVGPAAAGWWRPVILLPADWRSWDESERRAVLAHELAHIVRGDYAAGLVARLASALNGYHPLVWWMAGQLRLQQELAADAMGAHLAGSRAGYLVALSRLALRQDGRSPGWPARAFLPARGALIRRIKMLRDETRTGTFERPWSRMGRLATTACLLGATAAVLTLRGPACGGEDGTSRTAESKAPTSANRAAPPLYLREGAYGAVVLRPAAAARHPGIDRLVPFLDDTLVFDLSELTKGIGVEMARPGFIKLGVEDLEWVTLRLGIGRGGKDKEGTELHRLEIGSPTFRTVAPFDWLAFLRQWRFEFAEVRHDGKVYYKVTGPLARFLGRYPCVYLPDDRTLITEDEEVIRELIRREASPPPDFLRGPDWERACRGLLAVAISNQGGVLAKGYDLGRPDDAVALSLLKGVDHWIFSVDAADTLTLRASAACAGGDASEAIARTLEVLVKQGREALDRAAPKVKPTGAQERTYRMTRALLANLSVEHAYGSVGVHTGGFGTLADLASIVEEEFRCEAKPGNRKEGPKATKP